MRGAQTSSAAEPAAGPASTGAAPGRQANTDGMAAGRSEAPPPGHKVYGGADILAFIRAAGMQPAQVAQQAVAAGLSAEEVQALLGGADLAVDAAQEESLRAAVAASYAAAPAGAGKGKSEGDAPVTDADGSTCGCSGNPSTPAPRQVPAVTGTSTGATEVNAGTTAHTGSVGGGTVTLRHDIHYRKRDNTDREHGFAVRYQGPDSQNAHWLQFIWREIVRTDGTTATALNDSITTTGGSYQLTPGGTMTSSGTPGQNNYNTDNVPGAPDPFYENSGVANRTGDSTTIYDHPAAADAFVRREFANGATAVKSRAHFLTFLIQTDRVTYKTTTNMEWSFATATATPTPVFSTGANGAASNLAPAELRQRFHAQWPAFNFIT